MDQHSSHEVVLAVKKLLASVDYGQLDLDDWIIKNLPGVILGCSGKPIEEFISDIEAIIELLENTAKENEESPSPVPFYAENMLGEANRLQNRLQKCLEIFKQAVKEPKEAK